MQTSSSSVFLEKLNEKEQHLKEMLALVEYGKQHPEEDKFILFKLLNENKTEIKDYYKSCNNTPHRIFLACDALEEFFINYPKVKAYLDKVINEDNPYINPYINMYNNKSDVDVNEIDYFSIYYTFYKKHTFTNNLLIKDILTISFSIDFGYKDFGKGWDKEHPYEYKEDYFPIKTLICPSNLEQQMIECFKQKEMPPQLLEDIKLLLLNIIEALSTNTTIEEKT